MTPTLPVRVMVHDVWDEIVLDLPVTTTVSDVKRRALELTRVRRDPAGYVLKFRGAELSDESSTLTEAGITANGALMLMPRRRRPVR